jgi:hypothetical protein
MARQISRLMDVLDRLGNPDVTTITRIANEADGDFALWIKDRKNRRVIPHRMRNCDYVPVRNTTAQDGLWKIHGARQAVYAKKVLPLRDQLKAAANLTGVDQ